MTKYSVSRFAIILLSICMLFSSFNTGIGAAAGITDINTHWANKVITSWIDKGFTKGYADHTFKPDNTITRAEFIALINRSFGFTEKAEIKFTDANSKNWYYADVAEAVKAGYTKGYDDGTIGANNQISRQEAAVMIGRLLHLADFVTGDSNSFTDSSDFAEWSTIVIGQVAATKIMNGYKDDNADSFSFKPTKPITRAEALVSLNGAITYKDANYNTAGVFGPAAGSKSIDTEVIVNASGVTLQNSIINGNLILSDKIGEGDVTLKNVVVKGTVTINGGGANSIHLDNSLMESVIINKASSPVRIVAEGSTKITTTTVQSSVTLEEDATLKGVGFQTVNLSGSDAGNSAVVLKGTFDKLNVDGQKIDISIQSGLVQQMKVNEQAANNTLNLSANASLTSLILNAQMKVTGQGTIQSASINDAANASTFEKKPTTRRDANGIIVTPGIAPAFISVIASNTGKNVGLGIADSVAVTFNQNTNKPAITAANLNSWFVLSGGHSFGTALANSDISWNAAGNVLTISFSSITGTTFTVGDTIRVTAAAGLKNSAGTTESSIATSGASTGSFSAAPLITTVIASNTGNNLDKAIGDSVSITFDQNTNKPTIPAASLNSMFIVSNGHSFGTALANRDIQWNAAGNILTITFSNITGNTFVIGDTVTVSATANIKDSTNGTTASASVSGASTGSFTTYLEVKSVIASDTGNNMGLGINDSIIITFNANTNMPAITPANFKAWFTTTNGHSFGTSAAFASIAWISSNALKVTFNDVTGTTFTIGDYIYIQPASGIRDSALKFPVNTILTPQITGSFSTAPSIISVVAANTGNNVGLGVGDSIKITFDQNTNKPVIPVNVINSYLILSGAHSFGTNLSYSDAVWNSTGNILTLTFSNLTGTTFTIGDTITVSKSLNLRDASNSTVESVSVSHYSTGTFTSSPTVISVTAVSGGSALGLDSGDKVLITFNQETNKPSISPSSLNALFKVSNGDEFGASSAEWTASNVLTITFINPPSDIDKYFTIGDTVTISAAANIRDASGTSEAYSGISPPSTGTFSTAPKIANVVLSDNLSNPAPGLSSGDTIKISFDTPMTQTPISLEDFEKWFVMKNAAGIIHSLGTDYWTVDWLDNKHLLLTYQSPAIQVSNTTFAKGDTIEPLSTANIFDESGTLRLSSIVSNAATGTFSSPPAIINYVFSYTNDDVGISSTTITITFDQNTNGAKTVKDAVALRNGFSISPPGSLNGSHSFGKINDADIKWNAAGNELSVYVTKENLPRLTFIDGDTIQVTAAANLKDAAETTAASTSKYPN